MEEDIWDNGIYGQGDTYPIIIKSSMYTIWEKKNYPTLIILYYKQKIR